MIESQHTQVTIETALSRDVGLTTALAIGVGTMIAAGIFTLSGLAVRNVGSAAAVAFLLAAVVALLTALTYCEFVSIYPESGEGYLYARHTFSPPLAYVVGWTLFLGYTSSCAFYIASFSSYFEEFVWHPPIKGAAGVLMVLGLTALNIKGTKESGRLQVIVTLGKVLLLIWFILGGLGHVEVAMLVERFSTDVVRIGSTAAMVFITFFGFSAIAASAGEIQNPIKTVPRAIFLSMGMVTGLYTLVVLVIIAAGLTEYTEAALGMAARMFLGPIGGLVIVAGALFSMVSASNASIMAGSRVTLTMSRLGHLPERLGFVHPHTRTPVASLALVGGAILGFALNLRLEDLAHFADAVLLMALILVNGALIMHRRRYPRLERPFRVPLVPLVPGVGILANVYLLSRLVHHPLPLALASACLLLGVLVFVVWKGTQADEVALPGEPSRVALERTAAGEGRFRVLVPLAHPANVRPLIDLASAIASERDGEIVALRVALVPEQVQPAREDAYVERERRLLEVAHARGQEHGVPVTSLVRVGHDAARAILETARERDCNVIVLGWKGYTSTARKILGEVTDAVVRHARRDILLVKLVDDKPWRRLLLPTAGGNHARQAEAYAASIARFQDGALTVCSVGRPDASEAAAKELNDRLKQAMERLAPHINGLKVQTKVILHTSVSRGILQEAQHHDALVLGATGRDFYPQMLFGNLPEFIAKHAGRPVILVKHYQPVKALLARVMGG
jgi:APA family basic amino acid/polyamine antiporter